VGTQKKLHRGSPIGTEIGPTLEGRFARRLVSQVGILSAGHRGRAQALDSALTAIPEPTVVFDIGCGRGGNAFLLARRFPRASVIGIDIDPLALSTAERGAAGAGLQNLQFELTPDDHIQQTDQADLVVCVDVLEHIVDDEHFAKQVLDRVSPGGTLIVHVPLRGQHYHFSTVGRTMIQAIEEGRDPHVREGYQDADLRRLFAEHFRDFSTRQTLGGLTSVIADLEALSELTHKRLPRVIGASLLPFGGHAGGRWSKGLLAIGLDRAK
jgi:2-polyprenyl-3-methyl-5-hydroxy-6-metoxy-1,4-benzoquinol methylase